ncbi:MAG TPA: acyl carrier protein [Eoetvoesiella sp.]
MIAKMSDEELISSIRKSFLQAFDTEPETVTLESTPEDIPGWDSLGHTSLISHLEALFSISFDLDEMMEMEDVAAIAGVLRKRMQ